MGRLTAAFNSKYLLWLLLALPGIWVTVQYLSGELYYGEYIHLSGDYSARLLILTMAVTPLKLLFPAHRWPLWLIRRRRYFGVATFAYAVAHLLAYLVKTASISDMASEALEAGILTGWVAMFLFLALALTSNDQSVRYLKSRWKVLHRLVYLAAVLTFAHWILLAFDPTSAITHASVLAVLEFIRIYLQRKPLMTNG